MAVALDAAESGHLVIGSVTAHTTSAAIGRLIETAPYERQTQVALSLSECLRGAVAQVLLRKTGGGRVAARELLFNMPSVAALVAEGKIGQLPLAIDSGRKYGMVPMNDALLGFVQGGAVDAREAYRKAYDRVAFLELHEARGHRHVVRRTPGVRPRARVLSTRSHLCSADLRLSCLRADGKRRGHPRPPVCYRSISSAIASRIAASRSSSVTASIAIP